LRHSRNCLLLRFQSEFSAALCRTMSRCFRPGARSATAVLLTLTLAASSACTSTSRFAAPSGDQAEASPPTQPPPPQPPPVDLAGRWRLSMGAGGGCVMTLTAPGRRGRLYRTGGWLSGEFLYQPQMDVRARQADRSRSQRRAPGGNVVCRRSLPRKRRRWRICRSGPTLAF